jgi:hypothetical protein
LNKRKCRKRKEIFEKGRNWFHIYNTVDIIKGYGKEELIKRYYR